MTVARLWYLDRPFYGRSCRDCRAWVYDPDTGRPQPDRRTGLPMARPRATDPPCHRCPKTVGMKDRHWRFVSDPGAWAYRCFRHWRECEAVRWRVREAEAADPVVRRNAALFAGVRDAVQEGRAGGILALFGMGKR